VANKAKLEGDVKRFDKMLRNLLKLIENTEKNIKETKKQIKDTEEAIKLKRNLLTRLHNDLEDKSLCYLDTKSSSSNTSLKIHFRK
jgi:peptidoglycan hydrolase CwlO-like protein